MKNIQLALNVLQHIIKKEKKKFIFKFLNPEIQFLFKNSILVLKGRHILFPIKIKSFHLFTNSRDKSKYLQNNSAQENKIGTSINSYLYGMLSRLTEINLKILITFSHRTRKLSSLMYQHLKNTLEHTSLVSSGLSYQLLQNSYTNTSIHRVSTIALG